MVCETIMKNKNINKIKSANNNYFRYIINNIECLAINDSFRKNPLIRTSDNYFGDIKTLEKSTRRTIVSLIKGYKKHRIAHTKLFSYHLKIENGILYIKDKDWGTSKSKSYKKF